MDILGTPIVELRRYLLLPGRRDEMIEIFERELADTQEEVGIRLLGFYRDEAEPDHFVWFRGFADMGQRKAALTAFYTGPAWKEHAASVRATMVDTDDVLLLRPVAGALPGGPVVVTTTPVRDPAAAAAAVTGAAGVLVTEPAANTYPLLPVREGGSVVVTVGPDPAPDLPTRTAPPHVARLTPTRRSPAG